MKVIISSAHQASALQFN